MYLKILLGFFYNLDKNNFFLYNFNNYKYFYNDFFLVTKYVLAPRYDSEICLDISKNFFSVFFLNRILDLGAGSGILGFSLFRFNNKLNLLTVDCDYNILINININAFKFNFYNFTIKYSNWFKDIEKKNKYNLIISNPPYLSIKDVYFFYENNKFEPIFSLVSENKGLENLFSIIKLSNFYLLYNSFILLEHGYDQSKKIRLALKISGYINIFTYKDFSGLDRITCGEK